MRASPATQPGLCPGTPPWGTPGPHSWGLAPKPPVGVFPHTPHRALLNCWCGVIGSAFGALVDLLVPANDLAELRQGKRSLRARYAASPLTLSHLRGGTAGYEEKVFP